VHVLPTSVELTEGDIEALYAPTIRAAEESFRSDPQYLVDMAYQSSLLAYKRSLWEVRNEVTREVRDATTHAGEIQTRLAERGVTLPLKGKR
jgi:hypothetical protein